MNKLAPLLLLLPFALKAHSATMEVGVSIQGNQLTWFGLADPAIQGTISVTGLPSGIDGNSMAYDPAANRLLFLDGPSASNHALYSVDLAGIDLMIGGTVSAGSATTLGNLAFNSPRELFGGSFYNGSYYSLINGTDTLVKVDFTGTGGTVAAQTNINLPDNVTGGDAQMSLGDLAFDSAGKLWVSGNNENNVDRLWSFDSDGTTFTNPGSFAITGDRYNGIMFDVTGSTLYGFRLNSNTFGSINETTGAITPFYTGVPFTSGGDLGGSFMANVVPETSSTGLALAAMGLALGVRRRAR